MASLSLSFTNFHFFTHLSYKTICPTKPFHLVTSFRFMATLSLSLTNFHFMTPLSGTFTYFYSPELKVYLSHQTLSSLSLSFTHLKSLSVPLNLFIWSHHFCFLVSLSHNMCVLISRLNNHISKLGSFFSRLSPLKVPS